MRDMPVNLLDPRIKKAWRINDGLALTLCFLGLFTPFALIALFDRGEAWWAATVALSILALYGVMFIFLIVILPPIRYARWRYEVTQDYLDIARGIFWRKRFIIPFIRVQNTDTRQGPILRLFGLASVTVATAAGEHEIPGLGMEEADRLRDRAAELARLAREDV